jgi:selenocysteine lyase/cysteine desulfurase
MSVTRREFLAGAGLALAAGGLAPSISAAAPDLPLARGNAPDWTWVRGQFDLDDGYVHLAPFYISSHPRPVREAIENYRKAIDRNPVLTVDPAVFGPDESVVGLQGVAGKNLILEARQAAAEYVGGTAEEIAITTSTTMGLALVYHGLVLKPGQEILTTEHDFYPHHESIRLAALRNGASVRKIALFDSYDTISVDTILDRVRRGIRPETRVFAITWVHSSSGVKLPVRRIAEVVREANRSRDENDRVLLVVDGVHGFGVEDEAVAELGCDFFISGTHKWIFGPRGTGIVWARESSWALLRPSIPSFIAHEPWRAWMEHRTLEGPTRASWMTPGGFQAYEHQWALVEAFGFLKQIGRDRVAARTHEWCDYFKETLVRMPRVKLYTPRQKDLSAGLICFDIEGVSPTEIVRRMLQRRIVMTQTPYGPSFARIAPSILLRQEEVERTLKELRALA